MPDNMSPYDYIDARSRSNALLREAAFGDSPADVACAAAYANLSAIASWNRAAALRIRRPVA